jgi:hypothetical protein
METMSPEPELPWYQFTPQSLFLLTAFVAVLCSIGVCTHWAFSAILAAIVLIGGNRQPSTIRSRVDGVVSMYNA